MKELKSAITSEVIDTFYETSPGNKKGEVPY